MVIKWTQEAYWSDARFGKRSSHVFESQYTVPLLNSPISAIHKENGILMAAGEIIRPHRIQHAEIIDITPTILYLMGLPIPADMDGRPLMDIFTRGFTGTREVALEEGESVAHEEGEEVFSEEDQKKIEERLKGLGYLG